MALRCIESPDFHFLKAELDLTLGSVFTAVHVNMRSLKKYWKQFLITVEGLGDRVMPFVLTETNIPEINLGPYRISEYNEYVFYSPLGQRRWNWDLYRG